MPPTRAPGSSAPARTARDAPASIWRSTAVAAACGPGISAGAGSSGRPPCSACSIWPNARITGRSPNCNRSYTPTTCPSRPSQGSPPSGRGTTSTSSFACERPTGAGSGCAQRAELVEDEETREVTLVGIAFDVTERKREAEASATADQRLRDAVEAISEAFVLWDSSRRLVLCNSKYRRLHNLSGSLRRRRRPLRRPRRGAGGRQAVPGRARGAHLRGAPAGRAMAAGQ